MESIGWRITAEDMTARTEPIKNFIRSLNPEQKNLYEEAFGNSIMDDMSEWAKDIITVSAALFLGYIESATNYAQSHGGGGSNPGSGWGRKKDDDDDAWSRNASLWE